MNRRHSLNAVAASLCAALAFLVYYAPTRTWRSRQSSVPTRHRQEQLVPHSLSTTHRRERGGPDSLPCRPATVRSSLYHICFPLCLNSHRRHSKSCCVLPRASCFPLLGESSRPLKCKNCKMTFFVGNTKEPISHKSVQRGRVLKVWCEGGKIYKPRCLAEV